MRGEDAARRRLESRLVRLAGKYRTLAALRERREALEASGLAGVPQEELAGRTEAFRRVAAEFPGSLREIEGSPAELLLRKAALVQEEIDALRRDPGRTRPSRTWVAVVLDYHGMLREALAVKMWLARHVPRGGRITAEAVEAFREHQERIPRWSDAGVHDPAAYLERHRRPPGGRIHSLVWSALEERYGLARRALEESVFGCSVD